MNLDKILDNPTQLLATTGLYRSEFDELFTAFEPRWRQAFKHFSTHGKRRKLPLTSGQIAKDTKDIHGPKSQRTIAFTRE